MFTNEGILVKSVEGVAVEEQLCLPGYSQCTAYGPISANGRLAGCLHVVQIKSKLCKKEPTMKPQCPKDNAVVELAFKPIDWIAKVDVVAVDVVGNVTLKQRWQIMLQSRDRSTRFW